MRIFASIPRDDEYTACIVVFHWNRLRERDWTEKHSKMCTNWLFGLECVRCACAIAICPIIVLPSSPSFLSHTQTHLRMGKSNEDFFPFTRTWTKMREGKKQKTQNKRNGRSVVLECVCVALNARKSNRGYKKQPPTESVVCFDASIVPAPAFSRCCRRCWFGIGLLLELAGKCGCELVSPFVWCLSYLERRQRLVCAHFFPLPLRRRYIAEWHWCIRFVLFWRLSVATHIHIEQRQKQSHIARHKIRINSNAVAVAVVDGDDDDNDINTE